MKISLLKPLFFAFILFFIAACGTDVVDSGTYQGTIAEVEQDKTEIYVETADGKVLELYFTEDTRLSRGNEAVPFETLEEGMQVEVEVEKVGQRLNPLSVKIME